MSNEIQKLEPSTVRRIVAEQAITDLSGIVKELVDNALDAESKCINVRLFGHGLEIVEVTDDGTGVPPSSRELLATRHTTSKIRSLDDLYNPTSSTASLGFRGEALFSLASLSKTLIVATRTADEPLAQKLQYRRDGSLDRDAVQHISRKIGTTVAVVKPFHTLPARRANMSRQIRTERNRLFRLMQSYAIFHVGTRMSLIDVVEHRSGTREEAAIQTSDSATRLSENISSVLGHKYLMALMPFHVDLSRITQCSSASPSSAHISTPASPSSQRLNRTDWTISGYISKPPALTSVKRPSGSVQYYCINGRPVELPSITKLMRHLWQSFGGNKQPICILHLRIPNNTYDINVSPDKREVLLTHEKSILQAVQEQVAALWERTSQGAFPVSQIASQPTAFSNGSMSPTPITSAHMLKSPSQLPPTTAFSRLHNLQTKVLDCGDATDARLAEKDGLLQLTSPERHKRRNAFVHDLSKAKMQHELEPRSTGVDEDDVVLRDMGGEVVESVVVDGDADTDSEDDGGGDDDDDDCGDADREGEEKQNAYHNKHVRGVTENSDATAAYKPSPSHVVSRQPADTKAECTTAPLSSKNKADTPRTNSTWRLLKRRRVSRDREVVGAEPSHEDDDDDDVDPDNMAACGSGESQSSQGRRISREPESVCGDLESMSVSVGPNLTYTDTAVPTVSSSSLPGQTRMEVDDTHQRMPSQSQLKRTVQQKLVLGASLKPSNDDEIAGNSKGGSIGANDDVQRHRMATNQCASVMGIQRRTHDKEKSSNNSNSSKDPSVLQDGKRAANGRRNTVGDAHGTVTVGPSSRASTQIPPSPTSVAAATRKRDFSRFIAAPSPPSSSEIKGLKSDSLAGFAYQPAGLALPSSQSVRNRVTSDTLEHKAIPGKPPVENVRIEQSSHTIGRWNSDLSCQSKNNGNGGDNDDDDEQCRQNEPIQPVIWNAFQSTEVVAKEARAHRTEMRRRKMALRKSRSSHQSDENDIGVVDLQQGEGGEVDVNPKRRTNTAVESGTDADTIRLSKEDFRCDETMQVLGQFNLGFILARCKNNNLWILDQHACDEKYNFENLIRTTVMHEQKLIHPMPLELSASEEVCILDHMDVFEKNGFRFQFDHDAPIRNRLKLTALPHSGAQDGRKAVQFGKDDVSALCAILTEGSAYDAGDGGTGTDGTGRYGNNAVRRYASASQTIGNSSSQTSRGGDNGDDRAEQILSRLPKAIAMFASRACRSSIMIGTALSQKEMRQVVRRLADVEQPWNCPHGRPTMRHIGDIYPMLRRDEREADEYFTDPTATITCPTQMSQESITSSCGSHGQDV